MSDTDTTELNRKIAKLLGWRIEHPGPAESYSTDGRRTRLFNSQAWADSADVALRELWPDIVAAYPNAELILDSEDCFVTIYVDSLGGVCIAEDAEDTTDVAVALCNAWIEWKEKNNDD